MIGNYVKWNGQLAKILSEDSGVATIKVIKTKKVTDVPLKHLFSIKLQPAEVVQKKRELSKTRRATAQFVGDG